KPIDIHSTVEYQAARWIGEHLPGSRVFTAGSVEYWLNTFADNPQLGGGFGQGAVNPRILDLREYFFSTKGNGAETVLWLRAYGVGAIFVSGTNGREYFKAFQDPGKFRGLLPEIWRNGDDVIYGVPETAPLAHVLRQHELVPWPHTGFWNTSALAPYLAA